MLTIENTGSKWIAGLSNGETLVEGKDKVAHIKGEDSPWWKLQKYIKENKLTIHSFGIWVGDKHFNLPSIKPKFEGEVPLSYNCFRKVVSDVFTGENDTLKESYICAEAIYKDYKVQVWVDEKDTNKSWVNLINK